MEELTLKRGSGRTFFGSNWNQVAETKWEVQVLYVPNGREKYQGNRAIAGVEHAVFICLDEGFFAQPVEICKLPTPSDLMEVLYTLEAPVEEKPRTASKTTQGVKVLQFSGKNWKLAADKKWKSTTSFQTYDEKDRVGEKTIGQNIFDVYKASSASFFAVKRDDK